MRPLPHCIPLERPSQCREKEGAYRIRQPSPLESEKKAYNAGNEKECAKCVQLSEFGLSRDLGRLPIGHVEQKGNDKHGDPSEGQVDIETPAPGDI